MRSVVDDPSQFGIVVTEDDGRITRFLEKPKGGDVFSNTANTGVYLFEPEVFDLIPPDTFWGFGNNVFPQLLAEGRPLYGYLTHAYWMDVGNLKIYRQTNFDALNGRVALDFPCRRPRPASGKAKAFRLTRLPKSPRPSSSATTSRSARARRLGKTRSSATAASLKPDVTLRETILWEGARVSRGTHLERCVVGTNAQVQSNVAIFDANIIDPTRRMTAKT